MKTRAWLLFLALVLGLSITSCGSGGGGDDDDDPADTDDALIPALTADLTGWTFDVGTGADAAIVVKDGTATVSVTDGGEESDDVELTTKDPIALVEGNMYKLSLTVTGPAGHAMEIHVGPSAESQTGDRLGVWSQICGDGTAQTINRVFRASPYTYEVGMTFGSNGIDNADTVYKVSGIQLTDLGKAPTLTGSELLLNGDLSAGSLNWQTYYALDNGAFANTSFDNGRIDIEIVTGGDLTDHSTWQVHVRSKAWIALEEGKTYRLSYTCKGEAGGTLISSVQEGGGPDPDGDGDGVNWSGYGVHNTALDGTTQTDSFTFTAPADNPYINVQLNVGNEAVNGIDNDNSSLWIDDISLTPVD